jgi:hypothetical protein
LKYTKGASPNRYSHRYEIPKHAEGTGQKVVAKLAPVKNGMFFSLGLGFFMK